MDTKTKIQKIKKAVNSGMAKSKIDGKQGKEVKKLLEGKYVNEKSINRMYKNMQAFLENPDKYKELREKHRNFKPEIPKGEKIEEIKKAYKQGATKISLDPEGHGDAVTKLLNDGNVSIAKINQVYARLLELQADKPELSSKPNDLEEKVLEQEEQISYLLRKIGTLEASVKKLTKRFEEEESNKKVEKVLGITITQKDDIVKGKKYRRWYGIDRENGKRRFIYIGKDKSKAREKIIAWRKKNKSKSQ